MEKNLLRNTSATYDVEAWWANTFPWRQRLDGSLDYPSEELGVVWMGSLDGLSCK